MLADSERIVSLAKTAGEGTAKTEPNVVNKSKRDVPEIEASITCTECHDEKESDIHLDTDVTGDRKVDTERARATVLFRPYNQVLHHEENSFKIGFHEFKVT